MLVPLIVRAVILLMSVSNYIPTSYPSQSRPVSCHPKSRTFADRYLCKPEQSVGVYEVSTYMVLGQVSRYTYALYLLPTTYQATVTYIWSDLALTPSSWLATTSHIVIVSRYVCMYSNHSHYNSWRTSWTHVFNTIDLSHSFPPISNCLYQYQLVCWPPFRLLLRGVDTSWLTFISSLSALKVFLRVTPAFKHLGIISHPFLSVLNQL